MVFCVFMLCCFIYCFYSIDIGIWLSKITGVYFILTIRMFAMRYVNTMSCAAQDCSLTTKRNRMATARTCMKVNHKLKAN